MHEDAYVIQSTIKVKPAELGGPLDYWTSNTVRFLHLFPLVSVCNTRDGKNLMTKVLKENQSLIFESIRVLPPTYHTKLASKFDF
jgi:hypothetical protein